MACNILLVSLYLKVNFRAHTRFSRIIYPWHMRIESACTESRSFIWIYILMFLWITITYHSISKPKIGSLRNFWASTSDSAFVLLYITSTTSFFEPWYCQWCHLFWEPERQLSLSLKSRGHFAVVVWDDIGSVWHWSREEKSTFVISGSALTLINLTRCKWL